MPISLLPAVTIHHFLAALLYLCLVDQSALTGWVKTCSPDNGYIPLPDLVREIQM